jgi:hypothetical protein
MASIRRHDGWWDDERAWLSALVAIIAIISATAFLLTLI